VKPIDGITRAARGPGSLTRTLGVAVLGLCALLASVAQASTVLLGDTTLVSGSETAVFSFDVPGPGTVSIQLTNLDWPQALSSLSFMATTPNQVLTSWSDPGMMFSQSINVAGGGKYFADVMATAGGPLDLGAYSLSLTFTPAGAPVLLPSSGVLLLGGLAGILGLKRRLRTRGASATLMPPHPTTV
jgi:hypothetical protein